jgi:hypothetical protein
MDSSDCPKGLFDIGVDTPINQQWVYWWIIPNKSAGLHLELNPGESGSAEIYLTSPSTASAGVYTLTSLIIRYDLLPYPIETKVNFSYEVMSTNNTCNDGTSYGSCSVNKPKYCDNGNLIYKCSQCGCPDGYECKSNETCLLIPQVNQKDMSKYTDKTVFLISDRNWRDALSLVPVAVWTNDGSISKYPLLIYHEENAPILSIEGPGMPGIKVQNEDWQSFKFEGDFISRIVVFSGNPGVTYYLQLQDSDGNIIANSQEITTEYEYQSCSFIFNTNVNRDKNYKLVWKIKDNKDVWTFFSYDNPYPYGEFSGNPNSDIRIRIYGEPLPNKTFDSDSIIYFMQQYSPDKVIIIGETPQELDNLLIAEPELGAGIDVNKIKRVSVNDYLSYWQSFKDVVYVEDNYELSLLASTYASLINAPLIIRGTNSDNSTVFSGKNIICVGSVMPSEAICNEQYNLDQLQRKYLESTNTDKIILINPNDLNIAVTELFTPEKSTNSIIELYSKTSLEAPILASAKHELIINSHNSSYNLVSQSIKNNIESLNMKPNYLTILASPVSIQMSYGNIYSEYERRYLFDSTDAVFYANIDEDVFAELNFGRIFGLTITDASSYVARDLFYDETIENPNDMLFIGKDFSSEEATAFLYNKTMNSIGYSAKTFIAYPTASANDWKNKAFINYEDHGTVNCAGICNNEIPYLDNSFVVADACLTCAYEAIPFLSDFSKKYSTIFCPNVIRKGAIAYIGSTDFGSSTFSHDILTSLYAYDISIGETIKKIINEHIVYSSYWRSNNSERLVLLGDPTFKLPSLYKLPKSYIKMIMNDSEKTVYNITLKNRYFKFNRSIFHPEEPPSSDLTRGLFSSQNQLDLLSGSFPESSFVFELGPFPNATQFKGMNVDSSNIQAVTKWYDDPEMKNNIHYDIRGEGTYIWVIIDAYLNESTLTYDDNFHGMDITLTLEKV